MTIAEAYATGYGALATAISTKDAPDWFDDLDSLDLLLLGIVFPNSFTDAHQFGNTRTAWFRKLHDTRHWEGIGCVVDETLRLSQELDLPTDSGEVLHALAERLEAAGLDRRSIPKALHPAVCLGSARFVQGPQSKSPTPTKKAIKQARQLLSELDTAGASPDSCLDLVLDGALLLTRARLPVHAHGALMLTGLYSVLVATDREELADLSVRAEAWALGLADDSPLVPVVDTLLYADVHDLGAEETLGRLLMHASIHDPVTDEDRRWHSEPGTDFVSLAIARGHNRVVTRSLRTMKINPTVAHLLRQEARSFEKQHGRAPAPDDRIFAGVESHGERISDDTARAAFEAFGLHRAWIDVFLGNEVALPQPDGSFSSAQDRQDFHSAIERWVQQHPEASPPDFESELDNLRLQLAFLTIHEAAADANFARRMLALIESNADHADVVLLCEVLDSLELHLLDEISADDDAPKRAANLAEQLGGRTLSKRVLSAIDNPEPEALDLPALFILAVSLVRTRSDSL
ncbi:hypothetical protein ACFCV3_30855 [Kribbella sp. NPDC056345]|uniref:hypothetical protein n=1 Tax=Kribbella sp. NPDC056345 TaxID=3345789 RepID=UPI0035E0E16A